MNIFCSLCQKEIINDLCLFLEEKELDPGDNQFTCINCLNTDGNIFAMELSKKGARKGGLARAAKLSPERRKEIASKAARARWNKHS